MSKKENNMGMFSFLSDTGKKLMRHYDDGTKYLEIVTANLEVIKEADKIYSHHRPYSCITVSCMAQFLKLGLLPPVIDRHNKALYCATLETAQVDGNIIPLVYLLTQAVERMKEQLGVERYFER